MHKIRFYGFLSVFLMLVASARSGRKFIAEFWEHTGFNGRSIQFYEGERMQNLANWNDRISSYKIYSPVVLYEHSYGQGASLNVTAGSYSSVPSGWNDRISSIFDSKTFSNLVAELYENQYWGGAKITLAIGERLDSLKEWNDRISSFNAIKSMKICSDHYESGKCVVYSLIKVPYLLADKMDNSISSVYDNGEKVVVAELYEHSNFGGRVIKIYRNQRIPNLDGNNDIVSSYKATKSIVACKNTFHEGLCLELVPGEFNNIRNDFNDAISSVYDELDVSWP